MRALALCLILALCGCRGLDAYDTGRGRVVPLEKIGPRARARGTGAVVSRKLIATVDHVAVRGNYWLVGGTVGAYVRQSFETAGPEPIVLMRAPWSGWPREHRFVVVPAELSLPPVAIVTQRGAIPFTPGDQGSEREAAQAIQPGDSGSPLVNDQNQVCGFLAGRDFLQSRVVWVAVPGDFPDLNP